MDACWMNDRTTLKFYQLIQRISFCTLALETGESNDRVFDAWDVWTWWYIRDYGRLGIRQPIWSNSGGSSERLPSIVVRNQELVYYTYFLRCSGYISNHFLYMRKYYSACHRSHIELISRNTRGSVIRETRRTEIRELSVCKAQW